jgi:DNA-binding CsgD family transcriptional regulator
MDVSGTLLTDGGALSLDEARRTLSQISQQLGFDQFSYVGGRTFNAKFGTQQMWVKPPTIINTFSPEWINLYHANDYARVDPAISETLRRRLPYVWDAESPYLHLDKEQRRFFSVAHDFKVVRGLTIPVYGPVGDFAMFSYISFGAQHEFERLLREFSGQLHLASIYFHQRIALAESDDTEVDLSEREREVLYWAAAGKTSGETATIIGLGEKTVHFHLYKAMQKLEVFSKPHAVAKAILLGLIQP